MNIDPELHALLAAYVNHSATEEQVRRVRELIASDPAVAAECVALESLRRVIKVPHGDTPQLFGLERLQRDIDRFVRQQARLRFMRRILAIAASVVLALTAVIFIPGAQDNGVFRALGGGNGGAQLQVRFTATATQQVIQERLQEVGAQIVAGPSAVGAYRLKLAASADVGAVLATLRAHPETVEFAEREP